MVAILIYLPRAPGQINFKRKFGLVVTNCDRPVITQKRSTGTFHVGSETGEAFRFRNLPFTEFLGICYNLAFGLYPCRHDSYYPDLWNINYYSEKERIYSTFYPVIYPEKVCWPFLAVLRYDWSSRDARFPGTSQGPNIL